MKDVIINMVDLLSQYNYIKKEVNSEIISTIESGKFINGPSVSKFSYNLSKFLEVKHVIPCANGTDALQIAFMALELKPGDEIICPSWTYIATAEAASLLGLKPVFCDVDINTFNMKSEYVEPLINERTKAIVPVHLYGQSCEMQDLVNLAKKYKLFVVEDNAQAIGCKYHFNDGTKKFTGTIGDIGTTSFYPSKNLGCYGDGGAIFTNDEKLNEKIRMIANHGEKIKYHHEIIGCNSRLDSIQAAILNVKLNFLVKYNNNRVEMAKNYNEAFQEIDEIYTPKKTSNSDHVYHQYTIKMSPSIRNKFKDYLKKNGIPSMIYYPIPIHKQLPYSNCNINLTNTEILCDSVLSLPIHSEIKSSGQDHIINSVINYFK